MVAGDSPRVEEGPDWVDFDSVSFKKNLRRKKREKRQKNMARDPVEQGDRTRRPDAPSVTPSWMNKPVNSDASWMPVAPPQERTPTVRTGDDTPREAPAEPRIPRSPAERRRKLRLQQQQQQREEPQETPQPRPARSSSPNRPARSSSPNRPARSSSPNRPARSSSPSRPARSSSPAPQRGREGGSARERSGRSRSKTRSSRTSTDPEPQVRDTDATPKRGRRARSVGRNAESPRRARSTSRRRSENPAPPQPRSAKSTPSARPRANRTLTSQDRSASTRGPSSARASVDRASTHGNAASRPPRTGGSTTPSSAAGPGLPRPGRQARAARGTGDEGSQRSARTLDSAVGRDVSFGTSSDDPPTTPTRASGRKEGGIMERLFGDGGDTDSRKAYKRENSARTVSSEPGSCRLPDKVHPRILLSATVYHNAATNLWITTINTNQRGVATNPATAAKYLKAFTFNSEKEARESAIANAPPKMLAFNEHTNCFVCSSKFAVFKRACHCRNCGVCICNSCAVQWPSKMIPETYNLKREKVVRVCVSCDWLSLAFKKSLLKGRYEESIALYGSGNVNIRTPFPATKGDKKSETMHPIHCAVEGANLDVVRWLLEDRFCPIKKISGGQGKGRKRGQDMPIMTSLGRSVLNIAMARKQVDVLRYLVVEKQVSVWETKDLTLALHALEAALDAVPKISHRMPTRDLVARWADDGYYDHDADSCSEISGSLANTQGEDSTIGSRRSQTDTCIICYDNTIDSVITPCGHQICCLSCGQNMTTCPVCNGFCEIIRIYR